MDGGIARTQNAYRKQKSCVQTLQLNLGSKKQHTVLVVMDFDSCYERIWRAGLMHKASDKGICGRL